MKRIKLCLSLLLALPVVAFSAPTQDEVVKEVMTAYMKNNNIPGAAVELYVDGKPYSYYFGYANVSKKEPVTKKTIFEIGSISKVMTGLLLAEEIDFSRMHLNDSVRKFVPDLPASFNDVTLQNLATHTGGLQRYLPDTVKSGKELAQFAPQYGRNQQWIYSNVSIGLLGHAIEKRSYKDINGLFQKQILNPLGMQPIGAVVPKKLEAYYAQGYDKNTQPAAHFSPTSSLLQASGGVKASASDMQRFLSASIGLKGTPEKVFYPMRLTQTAFVKVPTHYQGLGWHILPLTKDNAESLLEETSFSLDPIHVNEVIDKPTFNGDNLIDKTGTTDGFRSYIAVIPNKKSGIVILTNRHATDGAIAEAGREILFKLTGYISKENA